jgi:chromate transporter
VRAALRGLTPAVIGLMVAAAVTLGGMLSSGTEAGIAAVVALAMTRFALNPVVVLGVAGLAHLLLRSAGL